MFCVTLSTCAFAVVTSFSQEESSCSSLSLISRIFFSISFTSSSLSFSSANDLLAVLNFSIFTNISEFLGSVGGGRVMGFGWTENSFTIFDSRIAGGGLIIDGLISSLVGNASISTVLNDNESVFISLSVGSLGTSTSLSSFSLTASFIAAWENPFDIGESGKEGRACLSSSKSSSTGFSGCRFTL